MGCDDGVITTKRGVETRREAVSICIRVRNEGTAWCIDSRWPIHLPTTSIGSNPSWSRSLSHTHTARQRCWCAESASFFSQLDMRAPVSIISPPLWAMSSSRNPYRSCAALQERYASPLHMESIPEAEVPWTSSIPLWSRTSPVAPGYKHATREGPRNVLIALCCV